MDPLASPSFFSQPSVAIFRSVKTSIANRYNPSEIQVRNVAIGRFCDHCQKENASSLCGRCKLVGYCNADCQKAAWQTHHKKICVPIGQPERYTILDNLGFTPLHYAVLFGKEDALAEDQKELLHSVKDSFNGTPADLKSYLEPVSEGEISLEMKADGNIVSLTQATFLQLIGVYFKDNYITNRDVLMDFHSKQEKEKKGTTFQADDPQVIEFEKKPPSVFLVEEPSMGWGLQAGQAIKKDDIICCVGGELNLEERYAVPTYRAVMYNIPHCDQSHFMGKGCFINDGPPNCIFTYINRYRGILNFPIVKALCDIQEGEFLHLSYGHEHELRGSVYVISEQSYQKVLTYCHTGRFYQFRNLLNEGEDFYFETMFKYIFDVLIVFVTLHLDGALKVKRTKKMMGDPLFKKILDCMHHPKFYTHYPEILEAIAKILKIQQKDSAIVPLVRELSKSIIEENLLQILLLMRKDESLSSASILYYQTFGELYDHFYLSLHGTRCGSYINKVEMEGETKPDFPLDQAMIIEKYSTLPLHFQKLVRQLCDLYIEKAEGANLMVKSQAAKELLARLNSPMDQIN